MTAVQDNVDSPLSGNRHSGLTLRWLAVAIALAAMMAYWPTLGNRFIRWDDGLLIAENPDFNPSTPSKWAHYWSGPSHHLYMPLTYTLWGIVATVTQSPGHQGVLAPFAAVVFHAVSLLLHGINAVLVFLILRRLVAGAWAAFFGAMLFAVHPLQTEAVAWAAEMSVLLSGLFSLWAILEFLHFTELRFGPPALFQTVDWRTGVQILLICRAGAGADFGIGTFALALALLSKPSAVVVPVLVLIIEVVIRRRRWRQLVAPLAIWAALCAPIAILTRHWQIASFTFPLWQRPLIAADALAFYLGKLLLPIGLLPDYCRTPGWLFEHHGVVALTWLAPAGLLVLAFLLWKRARWVMAAALLFAAALIPVLGLNVFVFQQFSTTADRYVYLAMLGPALVVATLVALIPRPTMFATAGVVLAVLLILSMRQASYWADTLALFSRVIDAHPDSFAAQEHVAMAYRDRANAAHRAGDKRTEEEELELALTHFQTAAKVPGDDGISYYNAADCLFRLYSLDPSRGNLLQEGFDALCAAMRDPKLKPRAQAYIMMGKAYYEPLRDYEHAAKCFRFAIQVSEDPQDREHAEADLKAIPMMEKFDASRKKPTSATSDFEWPTTEPATPAIHLAPGSKQAAPAR